MVKFKLKFKLTATCSAVCAKVNNQRSVELALWDGRSFVHAGNVTVPPNQEMPARQER